MWSYYSLKCKTIQKVSCSDQKRKNNACIKMWSVWYKKIKTYEGASSLEIKKPLSKIP